MTRDEILPIARKHGFAGCEVGFRMVSLVNEILALNKQCICVGMKSECKSSERTE